MTKAPTTIIAEPPLFEEWLESWIEKVEEMQTYAIDQRVQDYWKGYRSALRRVRQELENGG